MDIPYLPYGRQDKRINNNETFALFTFAKLLNTLKFKKVITLDAHSSVGSTIIDNFENIYPLEEINNAIISSEADTIAYPDKGARERYNIKDREAIMGDKVRCSSTGYITDYKITGNPSNKDILIIDDLVDGGMTFKLFAKKLYEQNAQSVHLYATHGIFSKGIQTLRDSGIRRIFTKEGEMR